LYQVYASRQTSHVFEKNIWPVSLGFSGLFDDFAFFGVLTVNIASLLEGFRRRFCGLMTLDDQVAMDFQNVFFKNV
jgi:hypothetical protein